MMDYIVAIASRQAQRFNKSLRTQRRKLSHMYNLQSRCRALERGFLAKTNDNNFLTCRYNEGSNFVGVLNSIKTKEQQLIDHRNRQQRLEESNQQ